MDLASSVTAARVETQLKTWRLRMTRKLIALSIAAAFALPLTVHAGGDKAKSADSGASPSASQGGSASHGSAGHGGSASGAQSMFKSLDKNNDGSISRAEAKGSPHEQDFAKLDKNGDGKLTAQEHAAAAEHAGEKAATGSTSASEGKAKSKY
jgi:hypothetical protein